MFSTLVEVREVQSSHVRLNAPDETDAGFHVSKNPAGKSVSVELLNPPAKSPVQITVRVYPDKDDDEIFQHLLSFLGGRVYMTVGAVIED